MEEDGAIILWIFMARRLRGETKEYMQGNTNDYYVGLTLSVDESVEESDDNGEKKVTPHLFLLPTFLSCSATPFSLLFVFNFVSLFHPGGGGFLAPTKRTKQARFNRGPGAVSRAG